ncbi:hypothetical protein [Bacillus paranthracis]|uniref:hypothetical protein n=1 Tax=Bacillus paranthracis TaxID=2026186 RepID=UPI0012F70A41|nr:hypothetical protein [Bacillus paranthracis]MDG0913260.1 hypothetical protein [Bacillus paranthracis]MDR4352542.1 hypothetical protein [Bacillus paranthracis]
MDCKHEGVRDGGYCEQCGGFNFNYDPEYWISVRAGQQCVWCGKRLESSDVSLNWCDPVCHECDEKCDEISLKK